MAERSKASHSKCDVGKPTVGSNPTFSSRAPKGCFTGEVTERPKVHDWKSCVGQPTEGSNPSPPP